MARRIMRRAVAERIHATAITLGHAAVLLRGPSGAGKSDLALRCLALGVGPLVPEPFALLADDQVLLDIRADGTVIASCPQPLLGLIEVRGLGIVRVTAATACPIRLVVDLGGSTPPPRYPGARTARIGYATIPLIELDAHFASAPLVIAVALQSERFPQATTTVPKASR
jgi:HPr kinase/phosphorylase